MEAALGIPMKGRVGPICDDLVFATVFAIGDEVMSHLIGVEEGTEH